MYVSARPLVEIQNLQEIFASTHLLYNLVYVHILYILSFLWWLIFPCFCEHFYITKTIICKNCNLCVDLERRGVQVLSNPPPPPPPRENLKLCLRPPIPQANLDFTWNPPPPPEKISDSLYRICSETNQTIFYQAVSHTKTWIWQRWINLTWQMSWQFITNIKTLKTHKHEILSILNMKIKIKTIIIMEDNLTIWTRKTCITCMLSIYWPCVRYKRF